MKNIITLSVLAFLSTAIYANSDMQAQIDALTKEVAQMKKVNQAQNKNIAANKVQSAKDNIKFGVDFRNAVDKLEYKNNDTDETFENSALFTSRLYLTMAAAPMKNLTFKGKLAIYSTWGAHLYVQDSALKDWSASSKPADTALRVKEAFFLYTDSLGEQPYAFSIGRRPSSNGFLANYRENEPKSGSPLAHITNMEVNAAMLMLKWDRFIEGAYSKFVYGRAHTGEMQEVYGDDSSARMPFAEYTTDKEDDNVDFFVFLGDGYNDGQYQLMYQWAHIFNTKGKDLTPNPDGDNPKGIKNGSGVADLFALSFKTDGVGEEITDFLDETTLFASFAATKYTPKDGYSILGSEDSELGTSFWLGAVIPDMMTDSGKLGFEFNHGSQYWTPMTWAEDTAMGSKIAVRGNAYEAYWNFNLFGAKYLPSQIRYTYAQHDYTPNINCAGWIAPTEVDITSTDLRIAVSYRY